MSPPASELEGWPRQGARVRFWRCADDCSEAMAVAGEVGRAAAGEQVELSRVAVVVEDRAGADAVVEALRARAIPWQREGIGAVLARPEVRDVVAWLRVLLDRGDARAGARALGRPPVELRDLDLAEVIQVVRRRRVDIVSALPAAMESGRLAPQARERTKRFVDLYGKMEAALGEAGPEEFMGMVLERLGVGRGHPLMSELELERRAGSAAWLEWAARRFARAKPEATARAMAARLVAMNGGDGWISAGGDAAREGHVPRNGVGGPVAGAVRVIRLRPGCLEGVDRAYLLGVEAGGWVDVLGASRECGEVVVCWRATTGDGPPAAAERLRAAVGGQWEEMGRAEAEGPEVVQAMLRAVKQELLDGVARIGGRLGELRLDTDVDLSHGVARYLELVKLAALLERPEGQAMEEALQDINARLAAAVTPLQREILESSTLDEELLGGTGAGVHAPGRSLRRFLPRRNGGAMLSASDVETYRSCPLKYKFARVLRIPVDQTVSQRFGIVVHQALERYHAGGGGTVGELLGALDACWARSGLDGPSERGLREKAEWALRRYHERLADQKARPVWFERSFAFQLGPHHVRGRVDRVDRLQDGGYELIDYKTGRPRTEAELREDVQLSLYAVAARECWGLQSSREAYHYLLDDVKVPLPVDQHTSERVTATVIEVGDAILQERFAPTPSRVACSMCDYRMVCPVAEV